jgi:hypothetical protein
MGRLDFCRISSRLVTFRSQRLFPSRLACLILLSSVRVVGQVWCPQNPASTECRYACSQTGSQCWELKGGNQNEYQNCLAKCYAKCPPSPPPQWSFVAPYDLTWKTLDLNGLPLNPRWALQDSPTCPALPSANRCTTPWTSPCTTWETQEVPLPLPIVDPLQPFNNDACMLGTVLSNGVNGHHENWATVTYSGAAQWKEHSTWGNDNFGADDDYNILISRDDQSAYTQDNPDGVLSEFSSDETIDHFVTPWWTNFRSAVNDSNAAAEKMLTLNGKPAYIVEVGMMGLDCAHPCGSEIHPAYALAVHTKDDPADDGWAIFGRNSGNEGFCATGQIGDSNLTTIYLSLPWYPGAAATAPVVTDNVWFRNQPTIQVTTFPQFSEFGSVRRGLGFVVELDLGDPKTPPAPLVHGEVHLRWDMQPSVPSGRAEMTEEAPGAKKNNPHGAVASTLEPEEAFAKFVAGLPPETRRNIKAATVHTHSRPVWLPVHPTNLSEAPAGFQALAPRYTAAGRDALKGIKISPDPAKTAAVNKINSILREAHPPKQPEQ